MMVPALALDRKRERASSFSKPPLVAPSVAKLPDRSVIQPTGSCVQLLPSKKLMVPCRRHTPVTGPMHSGHVTLESSQTSEAPGQWLVSSQKGSSAHR